MNSFTRNLKKIANFCFCVIFLISLTESFPHVVKSSVESAGMFVIICTCAIKATEGKTNILLCVINLREKSRLGSSKWFYWKRKYNQLLLVWKWSILPELVLSWHPPNRPAQTKAKCQKKSATANTNGVMTDKRKFSRSNQSIAALTWCLLYLCI